LSESTDFTVRFQGGNNAGHTLVVGNWKWGGDRSRGLTW
jgi:adenylosuccinate synthase